MDGEDICMMIFAIILFYYIFNQGIYLIQRAAF